MHYLDLEDVRAGMVLGQDVCDPRGRLLLEAGRTLTDAELRMLIQCHVAQVSVVPGTTPGTQEAGGGDADSDARLDARFRFCDGQHPLIQELRRLSRQRGTRLRGETDDD
jgi:hypothetical protein